MDQENVEEAGPKTRGYSLRTRSSVMTAKENVPAPKPAKKTTKKKGSTGAAAQRVLKDKNINVPNTTRRKTRAQLKEEAEQERKEVEDEEPNNSSDKRLTRATKQQEDKEVAEPKKDSNEENIGQDAAKESSELETEDSPLLRSTESVENYVTEEDQRKEDQLQEENCKEILSTNEKSATEESSCEKENVAALAPSKPSFEESNCKETETPTEQNSANRTLKEKTSFFDLPPEEQILIVRRKLERIIHNKETNQSVDVFL